MSQHPDNFKTVSLQLSEVLNDIGVHENMVLKRRRMTMLKETMLNSTGRLLGWNVSTYHFGSQTEGTTTIGLKSDIDSLLCFNLYNVIQDRGEWQPGMMNLLMIQDETTSHGYCLLQVLRNDEPHPLPISWLEQSRGRILLKNTILKQAEPGNVIIGPAYSREGQLGVVDEDYVGAFHCKSWPVEARPWLVRQGNGKWPTEEMKRSCEMEGCYVVPVGSKTCKNEELEWRISTSQAERCLMFSLNITQIRCYILMKMVVKTFINSQCDGVLSSFMCKTALLHCIQNTQSSDWQQHNLLACFKCCLIKLQNFVGQENCPHFITPDNNLMAGRISSHNKHIIHEILQNVIQSEGHALLQIPIDDLGMRLQMKMNVARAFQFMYLQSPGQMYAEISKQLLIGVALSVSGLHKKVLQGVIHDGNEIIVRERLSDYILTLTRTYTHSDYNSLEKSAFKVLAPSLSSSLGSVIASHDIYTSHSISSEALARFSVGLNSDVSSSRLKLASVLYCVGNIERAESVLRNTEVKYDLNTVEPICDCYSYTITSIKTEFRNKCNTGNEELIQHFIALCVRFLRYEIYCVPKELQYEMYRYTQEDMLQRDKEDFWMDWAVVDSLPYLYFLQYKTYRALQRVADQLRALANLARTTDTEENLGHRETALNLLGQCMEQENRHTDALHCYMQSLNIRTRNNAANVLICRLLYELVNKKETVLLHKQ